MARIAMVVWNEFLNDARVLKEAQTLALAGHTIVVHALHTPGVTQEKEVIEEGITAVRVARSPFWRLRQRKKAKVVQSDAVVQKPIGRINPLIFILRACTRVWTHLNLMVRIAAMRADVVHAHDVNTLVTAWLAAKLSGAKLVYDAHEISTSREGYASLRNLVGAVEKLLMPRANGTITTTDARAKFFARAYSVARPVVLQNRPRQQPLLSSSQIRDELALDKPWPIIVYQGGVQQGRGLERLARVAERVPNAYFVFIGGGRLDGILRQIAQELNIEDRVRFIPTVPLADLPSYTASADIGVQPIENTCLNHYTTDSNKLFEYVQAGLPIVASDLPEIRRIVKGHNLGLLVPPGDSAALSTALNELVEDQQKRGIFANNSKIAAETLNWEAQEHVLLDLYKNVLS